MGFPFRAALTVIAGWAACAGPPVVPKESPTAGHAAPATDAASAALPALDPSCANDADCVLNPVDCSECGRCPDDEPSAVMRAKVDALRAECARHAPVRLNPRAAALGLQAPACSPCPGGLGQPRPLWRAVCRGGACGVEPAGTQPPPQGDLAQPSSAVLPAFDRTCASDADCALTGREIEDGLPRTHACCPGCTERAVSREWLTRFQSACDSRPPPSCPPIGCPMPLLRAVCVAGQCASTTR
jgi:hypothetical protein